jgi:hypothetical protein
MRPKPGPVIGSGNHRQVKTIKDTTGSGFGDRRGGNMGKHGIGGKSEHDQQAGGNHDANHVGGDI